MVLPDINAVGIFTGGAYNSQDDKLPFAIQDESVQNNHQKSSENLIMFWQPPHHRELDFPDEKELDNPFLDQKYHYKNLDDLKLKRFATQLSGAPQPPPVERWRDTSRATT